MAKTSYNLLRTRHNETGRVANNIAALPSSVPGTGKLKSESVAGLRRTSISGLSDIVTARQYGRQLADQYGFSATQATLIATVISELSRNMVLYAKGGTISLSATDAKRGIGLVISAEDEGPGIENINRVMMGGYSTSGGLGLGLCGVRRIVDEFLIDSKVGKGTRVTATKWLA